MFLLKVDGEPYALFSNEYSAYDAAQEIAKEVYVEDADSDNELEDLIMSGVRVNFREISPEEFMKLVGSMEEFEEIIDRSLLRNERLLWAMADEKFPDEDGLEEY